MKQRLDKEINARGLATTRSQAENLIKLRHVTVNKKVVTKPGYLVGKSDQIRIKNTMHYVSRAAYKLESVAEKLDLDFKNKTVLDVGSSTGGFTDYALRHGAKKVIAVDVGTDQMHPSLRGDNRIELHEKTDIRDFEEPLENVGIVLIDVSFISLREILPHISKIVQKHNAVVVAMLKPQFESGKNAKHKGVVKNDTMRRSILKSFENWVRKYYVVVDKADSEITGAKGNLERFYLLESVKN